MLLGHSCFKQQKKEKKKEKYINYILYVLFQLLTTLLLGHIFFITYSLPKKWQSSSDK